MSDRVLFGLDFRAGLGEMELEASGWSRPERVTRVLWGLEEEAA
jgi:hypothetical protein